MVKYFKLIILFFLHKLATNIKIIIISIFVCTLLPNFNFKESHIILKKQNYQSFDVKPCFCVFNENAKIHLKFSNKNIMKIQTACIIIILIFS